MDRCFTPRANDPRWCAALGLLCGHEPEGLLIRIGLQDMSAVVQGV